MGAITLPVWLFIILSFSALLVFVRVVVFPLWASFWSARTRAIVEELHPHLQLRMSSFTLSPRRVLADRLACDPTVEASVKNLARERGVSSESLRREAWRMAWDIVPAFNPYFYFRTGYWIATRCLHSLYELRSVFEDERTMNDVSDKAAVVFVINHRSNIDYAIVNYMTATRTMLSFGVGEWSRVWPIQPMMRMAGGYFVRRDSDDPLYRLLLKRYVQLATEARVPHAIFLEGQLSPDGGVGTAKLGLLSYVTEQFDPRKSPDLIFMPVGINYDSTPEDRSLQLYSQEDFRAKGRRYVLRQGVQFAARVVWEMLFGRRSFGFACAHFGKPISFTQWLSGNDVNWTEMNREERFYWISRFGEKLTQQISTLVPATPVAVLCRVWFEDPALVISADELQARFCSTCSDLKENGCHVVLVRDDEILTFKHALDIVLNRKIVLEDKNGKISLNAKMMGLATSAGNSLSQFLE